MTVLQVANNYETLMYLSTGLEKMKFSEGKKYFESKDFQGRNILHHMAQSGQNFSMKFMLKKMEEFNRVSTFAYGRGANSFCPIFNPKDNFGKTPMDLAFENDQKVSKKGKS